MGNAVRTVLGLVLVVGGIFIVLNLPTILALTFLVASM